MAKAKKETEEKTESKVDMIDELLGQKEFKGLHHGSRTGEEVEIPAIISTGSFLFDSVLGGGYRSAGWSRFYSEPEHGKTAQGLLWAKNWQDYWKSQGKIGLVILFNAEGRITNDLITRSGLNLSKEVLRIIDSNSADFIYSFTERMIAGSHKDTRIFFLLDSTDACQRSCDKDKSLGEADKIGGTAAIISAAGKRLSLLFTLNSHHLYMTSQVRDSMSSGGIGQGSKKTPSGGWAAKFYSSLTGRIATHWSGFSILENPSDKASKEIGRLAQIKLEKTPNETTGTTVLVPIRYGQKYGVWKEYEAMMVAEQWGALKQSSAAWYEFEESLAQEMIEKGIITSNKFNGARIMRNLFDSNPDLTQFILDKYRPLAIREIPHN